MQQRISITRENVNDMAKGLAASVNHLGFRKNGKEMVASQALILLAKLKGLNEHTLMQVLEQPEKVEQADDRGAQALTLLRGLVRYLTRNYGDGQWDSSTREFLEEAAALVGLEPLVWQLDDEDEEDDAPATLASEHSVETAKALLLGKLGYTFTPDVDQPGLWVWTNGNEGCDSSFNSLDDALSDVWMSVAGDVMGAHNLSSEQWDALSLVKQMTLIEETLVTTDDQSEMAQAIKELEARWGAEHAWYGRDEWREDVAQGNTKRGYWEWVLACIESNGGSDAHCSECGQPSNDGEGWDGLCGDCADKAEVEGDLKDDAESLGINLDDAKFWVKRHFRQEFDDATHQQRFDWLHLYREYNGLTPVGSVEISPADIWGPRQAADKAFEDYDFGDDYTVADHNGWEWDGESILTKVVFLEDKRTPDAPTTKAIFRVNVVNGAVADILVSGI